MSHILSALLLLAAVISSAGAVVALAGWRRECARGRLLAERLIVEGRIEALTVQTLAAMRQAAREHWVSRQDRLGRRDQT